MADIFGTNNPGFEINPFTDAETAALIQLGNLGDPGDDRLLFWDDSAGSFAYLTAGAGLSIVGTTISASGATLADADYGDITVTSSGTVMTIDAGVVSLSKMANVATATVFYRKTAGTGAPEVQTLATLKTDLGLTGTNSGDQTTAGTTNRITVTNGSTSPVIDIAATYVGQTSITTLGTVTTGTLSTGAIIGGVTMTLGSDAANDIYYRNGSGVLTRLANGTTGQFLSANTGAAPSWAAPSGSGTVTNTGGTLTANSVILGAGTSDVKVVAGIITDGVSVLTLGVNTTTLGKVKMFGNTSGDATIQPAAVAGTATVLTLPAVTGTLATLAGTEAFTNKTYNGLTLTATTGTLTLTNAKTLSVTNTLTLSGTDSTTMTFPSTTATIARTDAGQTFTGVQTMTSPSITTSIVTGSTSFDAFNTTATTGNLFGAATTLTIGATTGTLNLRNVTITAANATTFNMNGASPTIATSSTATASVFNTNALTGNLFGAATTLTVGGTPTGAVTHNYSTNATATATTKTVNLGTGGAAGSTSNINIGATAGGTTTVNSPTISLGGTTGATTTGTIELGAASDTTLSRSAAGVLAVEGVVIPSISSTNTLTNKRITPRIGTEASSATSTPTGDTVDNWTITALAAADAIAAPTGTPTDGQRLIIRIKDNGTARALTWNAIYRASSDLALPSTTIISKTLYCGFMYNSADSKWDLLAVLNNF